MNRRYFINAAMGALASGFTTLPSIAQGTRTPNGYIRTNWSRDPYSFGSYSYLAKGSWRRDHVAMGRPVGNRVFFAGEATHPSYNSTVHAAYESGLIAAEAVFKSSATRIGIVGAGMSGLAAADALSKQGYEVTIWEARERIGGRIWTDSNLGTPLDLGASWIHGSNGNPLAQLAQDRGIITQATTDSYIIRGADGRAMQDRDAPHWLENVLSVQHSAGADSDEINTLAYWRDTDYGGEDVVFPGGYAQLFDAFASDLNIQFARTLTNVDFREDAVQLQDESGQADTFDAVIVTVPLGVLKERKITFTPPLPEEKQQSIANLGMGVLDKVYLRYDDVFWDADVTWIVTPENGLPQGQFNQWLNLYPYIGKPVIMAFNGAQPARELAELPDTEIVERAQQTLDSAYLIER
ncbi:FAD-dependent oxidoreductase [uncultured Roseobacter sp.]|uniref:flavin monoamine oxidase family protein n=1 Tax=uncultured Roseobacter sp. TaxID=114847 RepID=UPI0026361FD3|nr:FAD-dependent oxidoreductase [uncultured Roseobacter sp.]